jgi:hypothetical protein
MVLRVGLLLVVVACYQFPTVPPSRRWTPRTETYEVTQQAEGVTVAAAPDGNIGWELSIRNDTDESLTVAWDESSFVAGDGRSLGRLVPGTTRRMDLRAPHPAEPLPPHATVSAVVIPLDAAEEYAHGAYGEDFGSALRGGRLVLTIRGSDARTWQAMIAER